MDIKFTSDSLNAAAIVDRWEIKSTFFGDMNHSEVEYKICESNNSVPTHHAVFYLHGFGGSLDDTPFLEDHVCDKMRLIRVANFGTQNIGVRLPLATFGDVCCIMHNAAQAVSTIADRLSLQSYDIVGHSWGGMVATINGLRDTRCLKAMLLVSSPDICDVLEQLHELHGLHLLRPIMDLFVGPLLRWEASKAKYGNSSHQLAWEHINPFALNGNPALEMLIYNRAEDLVMRTSNIEHFVAHARERGLTSIQAEFVSNPDLHFHDMPLEMFADRMKNFLFEQSQSSTVSSILSESKN